MPLKKSGLTKFRRQLPGAIDRGVQTTAESIEKTAKEKVPKLTHALETSIEVFGAGGSMRRSVEAGQGLNYAAYVEYGTSNPDYPVQPFMTPAAEQHRPDLKRNVAKEIKSILP